MFPKPFLLLMFFVSAFTSHAVVLDDALEEEKNDTIAANKSEYDKLLGEPHETAEGLVTFHLLKDKLYCLFKSSKSAKNVFMTSLLEYELSNISENLNSFFVSKTSFI